jgi:hypothetical protein
MERYAGPGKWTGTRGRISFALVRACERTARAIAEYPGPTASAERGQRRAGLSTAVIQQQPDD